MLFSVFTSLATATSAAAFSKHTSHPLLLTVGYAAVLTLIGVWLARGGLAWLHTPHRQRAEIGRAHV